MSSLRGHSNFRLVPITVAQAFGVTCGIAGVKLNSHVLPPEVLGQYGLFLTVVPIGMWVVHAGVVKFVARHWVSSTARPALLRRAFALWARRLPWLAVAAIPAALALGAMVTKTSAMAWVALFSAAALLALGTLAQSALQAERAHWRDCGVSICSSLTRTFVPPLAFVLAGASLPDLWAGFGLHAAAFAMAGAFALRRYWPATPDAAATASPDTAYSGPLFVVLAAAGWLLAGLNRWLVAAFFGETEAGYFTLAGGAAVVLTSTLGAVFMQFFQPGFFALGDVPEQRGPLARRVDRAALVYALTGFIAVAVFAFVAPWLVGPIIDERYRGALPWILPSGCFGVTLITLVFYQSLLLAGRRERACAPVELTTAAVLTIGCVVTAAWSRESFFTWLLITPLVPWIVTRPLARKYFFNPEVTAGLNH